MIRLYKGIGSDDFRLIERVMSYEEWFDIRRNAHKLLASRGLRNAAACLNSHRFEIWQGTNFFKDNFQVLYQTMPADQYVMVEETLRENADVKEAIRHVVRTINEISNFRIRHVALGVRFTDGTSPVQIPALRVTSATVEAALGDAEYLMRSRGAASAMDRVHTALHGYLRSLCAEARIVFPKDASITKLYKLLRSGHPGLTGDPDANRIALSLASALDAINSLRNNATLVHPNETLMPEPEAVLAINAVRSLLHYLDAKLA